MSLSIWQRQYDLLSLKKKKVEGDLAELEFIISQEVTRSNPDLSARAEQIKKAMLNNLERYTNALKEAAGHL